MKSTLTKEQWNGFMDMYKEELSCVMLRKGFVHADKYKDLWGWETDMDVIENNTDKYFESEYTFFGTAYKEDFEEEIKECLSEEKIAQVLARK